MPNLPVAAFNYTKSKKLTNENELFISGNGALYLGVETSKNADIGDVIYISGIYIAQ